MFQTNRIEMNLLLLLSPRFQSCVMLSTWACASRACFSTIFYPSKHQQGFLQSFGQTSSSQLLPPGTPTSLALTNSPYFFVQP
ncbi:hypothetical protein IW262DRAFT_1335852 [Armillaria fumosa]|nr:hypothetical protein IW262DRAFT_1335852 [Armillaria fumosa]